MKHRGLSGLVVLLVVLAAGPLVAAYLPPGPGSLLAPASVAVAAAAAVILYALFAWPVLATSRTTRDIPVDGGMLLAISLPFVVGLGVSHGAAARAVLAAAAVVTGAIATTGIWLAGPGRSGRFDRHFAAFWVFVTAVLPIAAYVLLDFAGTSFPLGFKVSPVLAVRRILLEMPGASPAPFLLTGLAFLAVATAGGMVRRGVGVAAVLLLAGSAAGVEVVPAFGDRYVPGRPVLLRLSGTGRPVARVAGQPWHRGIFRGHVYVPGTENLREVEMADGVVPLSLRPVPAGRWLVALGPVSERLARAAAERGFVISRAAVGPGDAGADEIAAADGVVNPDSARGEDLASRGIAVIYEPDDLPPLPAIRRPWEEPGRVLSAEGLERMFPPRAGPDPARSRTAFVVLGLFGIAAIAVLRFTGRRGGAAWRVVLLLFPLSAATAGAAVAVTPPAMEWSLQVVSVVGQGRETEVQRIRALRPVDLRLEYPGYPVVLGRNGGLEVVPGMGVATIHLSLKRGEVRYVALTTASSYESKGPFDFFLTPDGLAKPGEAALPAGEFLERHFRGPDGRTTPDGWLVRKLLRLNGSIPGRHGVRIPKPGRLEVQSVR